MWSFSIQIGNIWNTVWGTHDTSIFQKFVCEMGSEPPLLPSKHNSKSIRKKMTEMDLLSQVSCISVVIHQKYSWDGHKFLFQTENFMKYLDSSILIVGQGKSVNWSSLFEVPMTPQFFKNLSVKWDQNPLCYHLSIILNQ